MTGLIATVLVLNAVFNLAVWPMFLRRVIRDPRARDTRGRATTFLRVHVVLVTAAVVLGLVSAGVAIALLVS